MIKFPPSLVFTCLLEGKSCYTYYRQNGFVNYKLHYACHTCICNFLILLWSLITHKFFCKIKSGTCGECYRLRNSAETLIQWTQEMAPQALLASPKIFPPWKRASSYCSLLLAHFMDSSTTVKNLFYTEKIQM